MGNHSLEMMFEHLGKDKMLLKDEREKNYLFPVEKYMTLLQRVGYPSRCVMLSSQHKCLQWLQKQMELHPFPLLIYKKNDICSSLVMIDSIEHDHLTIQYAGQPIIKLKLSGLDFFQHWWTNEGVYILLQVIKPFYFY